MLFHLSTQEITLQNLLVLANWECESLPFLKNQIINRSKWEEAWELNMVFAFKDFCFL